MIFNTSTAFNIQKKDVKFLDAGIHEDVSLEKVRHDRSPNGNMFIEFTFAKDGTFMTHTEYEPTKFQDQTDVEFEKKINTQVARILQIMEAFYSRDQLNFTADSFDTFCKWVATLMSNVDKNAKVRLKIVYGMNGYTTLPKYAVYTFIEPMSVLASNSKIKKLGIDEFNRPEHGDKEADSPTAESAFTNTAATEVSESRPF